MPRVLASSAMRAICWRSSSPLGPHLAGGHAIGHERAVAVAAFEKPLGGQPLVDPQNRVLIDGQFGGQCSDGRQPLAGLARPLAHCARIWAAICRVMGIPEDVSTRIRTGGPLQ